MITYMAHTVTTVDHQDEPEKWHKNLFQIHIKSFRCALAIFFVMFLAATYFKWEFHCSSFSFQDFSVVNMRLNMYYTAAWFVDCFSAFAIGQCQSYPKPCMGWCLIFPRNVIMLTPCFVFLTEPENYCYNKTHILITPVFPDSSLKMWLFCSLIVSKIYNSIKVCTFLNNNLYKVQLFVSSMGLFLSSKGI